MCMLDVLHLFYEQYLLVATQACLLCLANSKPFIKVTHPEMSLCYKCHFPPCKHSKYLLIAVAHDVMDMWLKHYSVHL